MRISNKKQIFFDFFFSYNKLIVLVIRGGVMKIDQEIIEAIKKYLEISGDTQSEFAKKLGMNQSNISRILKGVSKTIKTENWLRIKKYIDDFVVIKDDDFNYMYSKLPKDERNKLKKLVTLLYNRVAIKMAADNESVYRLQLRMVNSNIMKFLEPNIWVTNENKSTDKKEANINKNTEKLFIRRNINYD